MKIYAIDWAITKKLQIYDGRKTHAVEEAKLHDFLKQQSILLFEAGGPAAMSAVSYQLSFPSNLCGGADLSFIVPSGILADLSASPHSLPAEKL